MQVFHFTSAHAHINLLGWVSLAMTGVIYHLFPLAGENKLASIHFWLMIIGIPLLTFAMILFGLGKFEIGRPMSGIDGRQYVSQLAREAEMSRPLLSMHLQKLENARVVSTEMEVSDDGKAMKYYELTPSILYLRRNLITINRFTINKAMNYLLCLNGPFSYNQLKPVILVIGLS